MAMAHGAGSHCVRSRLSRTDFASENFRCVDGTGVRAGVRRVLNIAHSLLFSCSDPNRVDRQAVRQRFSVAPNRAHCQLILVPSQRHS